jgi:hypothetical protein
MISSPTTPAGVKLLAIRTLFERFAPPAPPQLELPAAPGRRLDVRELLGLPVDADEAEVMGVSRAAYQRMRAAAEARGEWDEAAVRAEMYAISRDPDHREPATREEALARLAAREERPGLRVVGEPPGRNDGRAPGPGESMADFLRRVAQPGQQPPRSAGELSEEEVALLDVERMRRLHAAGQVNQAARDGRR